MVIDAGETEVLERQVPQPLYGVIDADPAVFDLLQQLSQELRLNGLIPFKKFEIRISKSETNPRRQIPMTETLWPAG